MLCSYKLSLHASLGYASFQHRDRTLDFCPSFYFTVLSGFQPNYAIKRDLRENTGFKLIIGRVGPLFWLLEPKMKNRVGWVFFSGSFSTDSFCFVSAIKAVYALSLSPTFYPPSHSICWFAVTVKSYFRSAQ